MNCNYIFNPEYFSYRLTQESYLQIVQHADNVCDISNHLVVSMCHRCTASHSNYRQTVIMALSMACKAVEYLDVLASRGKEQNLKSRDHDLVEVAHNFFIEITNITRKWLAKANTNYISKDELKVQNNYVKFHLKHCSCSCNMF